jgi:hypothetical protein
MRDIDRVEDERRGRGALEQALDIEGWQVAKCSPCREPPEVSYLTQTAERYS